MNESRPRREQYIPLVGFFIAMKDYNDNKPSLINPEDVGLNHVVKYLGYQLIPTVTTLVIASLGLQKTLEALVN